MKSHRLSLDYFISPRQKKFMKKDRDFINSLLINVDLFFKNEEKFNNNKFYIPQPPVKIRMVEGGGISSLQYNLFQKYVSFPSDKRLEKLLIEFFKEIIELEYENSISKRRIVARKKVREIYSNIGGPINRVYYKDPQGNLLFKDSFFEIFEKYRKRAVLLLIKKGYDKFDIFEFYNDFPILKKAILDFEKGRSKRQLSYRYDNDKYNLNIDIGNRFLKFCSQKLRNADSSKVISDFAKIRERNSYNIKPHILKKMAKVVNKFERQHIRDIKAFRDSIFKLLEIISFKNISTPFWEKNNHIQFFFYITPFGFWEKDNHLSMSKKFNICQKVPIPLNVSQVPRDFFYESGRHIFIETKTGNTSKTIEDFYKNLDLNHATKRDKEFLTLAGFI